MFNRTTYYNKICLLFQQHTGCIRFEYQIDNNIIGTYLYINIIYILPIYTYIYICLFIGYLSRFNKFYQTRENKLPKLI